MKGLFTVLLQGNKLQALVKRETENIALKQPLQLCNIKPTVIIVT